MTVSPATAGALYDVDPDAVAALVLSCSAVAGLSGGPFGAAASYLPGRRVVGVRLSEDVVEAHIVMRYGVSVAEVAGQVQRMLAGQVGPRRIDVVVEDVAADPPGQVLPQPAPPPQSLP